MYSNNSKVSSIRELSINEVSDVSGGPLPLLLIAFGKGVLAGASVAGIGLAVADALGGPDFM
jgi:hypothetical protein